MLRLNKIKAFGKVGNLLNKKMVATGVFVTIRLTSTTALATPQEENS